ncbi:MAG: ArsR/SmtB family transcription factor [Phycisphaerales bacterium]
MLNERQAARVGRGVANHRRVQLLRLLDAKPGLPVGQIARQLKLRQPTATEHVKKMIEGGLVISRRQGASAKIELTDRGRAVLKFLDTLA